MSEKKRIARKASKAKSWPALQLLEFSVSLGRLMKDRRIHSQAELARVTGKKTSWLSSMFSGNENMTIQTMQALAASLDATVHLVVTDREEKIRWVPDAVSVSELAPDLSLGWPSTAETEDSAPGKARILPYRYRRMSPDAPLTFGTDGKQSAIRYG